MTVDGKDTGGFEDVLAGAVAKGDFDRALSEVYYNLDFYEAAEAVGFENVTPGMAAEYARPEAAVLVAKVCPPGSKLRLAVSYRTRLMQGGAA